MEDLLTGAAGLTIIFFIFLVLLAILWTLLPFAIFGIKKRLDEQIKIGNKLVSYQKALYEYIKNAGDNEVPAPPSERPE